MGQLSYLPVDEVVFSSVERLQPRGVKTYHFAFRDGKEFKRIPVGKGLMPCEQYVGLTRFQPPMTVIVVDQKVEGKSIEDTDKLVFVFPTRQQQEQFLEALETYTGVKSWTINSA